MSIQEVYNSQYVGDPLMVVIVGYPGSGKSTFARSIGSNNIVYQDRWSTTYMNDYAWLFREFRRSQEWEEKQRQLQTLPNVTTYRPNQIFKPNSGGGFDIVDYRILDEALDVISQRTFQVLLNSTIATTTVGGKLVHLPSPLVIVDFARPFNSLGHKVNKFFGRLKEVAVFIVLDVSQNITKANILERQSGKGGDDFHNPGSPEVLDKYYYRNYIPGEQVCATLARNGFRTIHIKEIMHEDTARAVVATLFKG
jgi:hypothetical protein